MAKQRSEQLADLSAQAKKVEDAFAAIGEETDAKAAEQRDKSWVASTAAIDKMEQGMVSTEESVAGHWRALQN